MRRPSTSFGKLAIASACCASSKARAVRFCLTVMSRLLFASSRSRLASPRSASGDRMGVLSRYDYPLYVNRRFLDCSGLLCFSQPTPPAPASTAQPRHLLSASRATQTALALLAGSGARNRSKRRRKAGIPTPGLWWSSSLLANAGAGPRSAVRFGVSGGASPTGVFCRVSKLGGAFV